MTVTRLKATNFLLFAFDTFIDSMKIKLTTFNFDVTLRNLKSDRRMHIVNSGL